MPGLVTKIHKTIRDLRRQSHKHVQLSKYEGIGINKLIGRRIKEFRLLREMTLKELSNMLGITFQQLQKYEKGQNNIRAYRLYRISKILNVKFEDFFKEETECQ